MFSEKTLYVGRKFVKKIAGGVRTQGATEAVHRIPQAPIMPRVIAILQRAAEQCAQKLRCVERAIAAVVLRNHNPGNGIPNPGEKPLMRRVEISGVLMQHRRQREPLDESAGFCIRQSRTESFSPTLHTSPIVRPLACGLSLRGPKGYRGECIWRVRLFEK
jgi:hypothetical protein